jgi:hypothetical protein
MMTHGTYLMFVLTGLLAAGLLLRSRTRPLLRPAR